MSVPVSVPVVPVGSLDIDLVGDFSCPWTFLGTRRLARALDHLQGVTVRELRWHPFRLQRPEAGVAPEWRKHLAARLPKGVSVELAESSLAEAGEALGIRFDFSKLAGLPDTLAAHRLVKLAVAEGLHGRVLDAIDRLGIRDNTIVLFMTDNGTQAPAEAPRFNAGMRGQKASVYEGGIRVPCFVRWPGKIAAGKDVDRLTAHIDIAPTLLELCGIKSPQNVKFDGKNLAFLLRGESPGWLRRTLFFQWHRGDTPEPYNNCCACTQQYKLVNGVELYDLQADPAEANDIATQHPGIVQRLRKEYEAWFVDVSTTRGYEPPEIIVGDEHSNPVYLTVQDMRGGEGGGYGSNGFWKTRFARDGVYDVTLRFNKDIKSGTANVQVAGVTTSSPITEGAESTTIKGIKLYSGPASVRAWANKPEPANGAQYVDIVFVSA